MVHPLDDLTMRDAKGRPLQWLRDILNHRGRLEYVIRYMMPNTVGYTTDQILGDALIPRARDHLINVVLPRYKWDDPVL